MFCRFTFFYIVFCCQVSFGYHAVPLGFFQSSSSIDTTPDPISWADFSGLSSANSTVQTFSGINTAISVQLSVTATSMNVRYRVNAGTWTAFSSSTPATISVNAGDSLEFSVFGLGSSTGTITITNLTSGSTVLDTTNWTVASI